MADTNQPVILTDQEFAIAQALARELSAYVDRNEVGKVFDYFRRTRSKTAFFKLLQELPRSGYVRSNKTREYLKLIAEGCHKHLRPITDDERALAVLGWAFRLMTYYQTRSGTRYSFNR